MCQPLFYALDIYYPILNSQYSCEAVTDITPVLLMRKLRYREVK